jgi:hypothetical protein
VILALEANDAGRAARRVLWLDLTARGIDVLILPASALAGAKDLGECWERYRSRMIDEFQFLGMAEQGHITGMDGGPFGSTGIIVNCPIVARLL